MIRRILLVAMMLLGLTGFGAIALVTLGPTRHAGNAAGPPKIMIVTAAGLLSPGTLLQPADIAAREVPRDQVPESSFADTPAKRGELLGSMVRRPVLAGATLLADDVLLPGDHGFLAAVLRPGKRATTVAVDAVSGSAGLIWPGDAVDLILTQDINDANLAPGHRVAAETVLRHARVIAIDQHLAGAPSASVNDKGNRTVTLEVDAADAERVEVAARIGRLSLVVCSTDPGGAGAAFPSGPTWAGDVSRALEGSAQRQAATASVVRVFTGTADGKEFHF
jgi:pilus assembly protein CpaB